VGGVRSRRAGVAATPVSGMVTNRQQRRHPDWRTRIEQLTGEPAVPIRIAGMGRTFWAPRRYVALAAAASSGTAPSIRAMAARSGYSTKGAWAALHRMAEWGVGVLTTKRGCHGETRFRLQSDVSANVSTAGERLSEESRRPSAVMETFAQLTLLGDLIEPTLGFLAGPGPAWHGRAGRGEAWRGGAR
jgi:hypothetical protein